jgi:hypothetical protein
MRPPRAARSWRVSRWAGSTWCAAGAPAAPGGGRAGTLHLWPPPCGVAAAVWCGRRRAVRPPPQCMRLRVLSTPTPAQVVRALWTPVLEKHLAEVTMEGLQRALNEVLNKQASRAPWKFIAASGCPRMGTAAPRPPSSTSAPRVARPMPQRRRPLHRPALNPSPPLPRSHDRGAKLWRCASDVPVCLRALRPRAAAAVPCAGRRLHLERRAGRGGCGVPVATAGHAQCSRAHAALLRFWRC